MNECTRQGSRPSASWCPIALQGCSEAIVAVQLVAPLALFRGGTIYPSPARVAERPAAPGVFKASNRLFVFCRFCHFRVLTPKMTGHITRLADDERPCGTARSELRKGQRCCRATGRTLLFPKIRKLCFHDVALERGSRGPLFDIVKMEERETWTARFLRSDREIGQTDFDGTFSQEVHYQSHALRSGVTGVCPRQCRAEMRDAQNVQTSTKSDIKLESLILAQNERWRQA